METLYDSVLFIAHKPIYRTLASYLCSPIHRAANLELMMK